jgi:hypothetical protein
VAVQHPHRHQLRPVGEAGDADRVAGLLADRPGDVGAVPVLVEREAIIVDEVVPPDELLGGEVGTAQEGAEVAIGDPGVEHRDGDSFGARPTRLLQVLPGAEGVDAARGDRQPRRRGCLRRQEVPLLERPAPRRGGCGAPAVEGAGVVGEGEGAAGLGGGGGDVVRLRVLDRGVAAQGRRRRSDAGRRGQRDDPPALLAGELDDHLPGRELVRRGDLRGGARRRAAKGEGRGQAGAGEYRKRSSHRGSSAAASLHAAGSRANTGAAGKL